MKKTKLFSRIFAAALAVTVAATTLITNSGAGMLAFAADPTYKVSIISPDVPADDKTYTYNFYQIIAGEVEEEKGESEEDKAENILANPKWGAALGGENFDKVPSNVGEDKPRGSKYSHSDNANFHPNAGIGYYSPSEVLLGALSGYMSCDASVPGSSGAVVRSSLTDSAHKKYLEILHSYGASYASGGEWMNNETLNYFYEKFNHGLIENSNNNGEKWGKEAKTRDVKGLVELLNAGSIDGKLKTTDRKAFADLLFNGVKVEIDLGTTHEEEKDGVTKTVKDIESYTYNFITGAPQATKKVEAGGTFEVEGLAPGYYLVACVGEDNKLSNNGYETSMPVKPISTMLILVGPANKGVTEIVGKNAYTVPTVTLDMYQKPVKLSTAIKTGTTDHGGYVNKVEAIDTIIKESENNWKTTGSFDYYAATDRQEAILYRIGITLPLNFDQYKDSGYFLAVLDQYRHYSSTVPNGEIERVTNVRPYVYVKSGNNYTPIGRCRGNINDKGDGAAFSTTVGEAIIETTSNSIGQKLTNDSNINIYNMNSDFGFYANDMFCFGDLYNYTVQSTTEEGGEGEEGETAESEAKCIFNPGDTIYIYYPAILATSGSYLLNANRVWAVYSNNPYANKVVYDNASYGCNHVSNGDVGITRISEANVNTYNVKLNVEGEGKKYVNGAIFALYREVEVEVEGEDGTKTKTKTKEYACAAISASAVYVNKWIPESELEAGDTIEDRLFNTYKKDKAQKPPFLANNGSTGVAASTGIEITGLAAGEYYLLELTISSDTSAEKNPKHANLTTNHYELAKEPIKFNISNEYNQNVSGYLGTGVDKDGKVVSETATSKNSNTFISKLTVDFKQDNPERTIDTYIDKPNQGNDAEGKPVPTKNGSITTTLNGSVSATDDGKIEIRVYHKTLNLIWLPETGGIGTTIFFIVGGTIVVAATVLIVTRFRVKRERL